MKAVVMKASDSYYSKIKYFKNLKSLLDFMEECGHDLILQKNWYSFDDKEIKAPGVKLPFNISTAKGFSI